MRCGIYVRVSTDDQRDNGYSIDSQLRMIKEHCERNNYDIVDVYNDAGYSGKDLMRPEMQRLLEDIKSKKIDILVAINKLGISKSEFVRKIIYEFDESVLYKSDINKIHNEILEFIESLSKIRNTLDRHYYKHEVSDVDAIIYKLESLLKEYNIK